MDDRPVCWVCKRVIRHETREDWTMRATRDYCAQAADACGVRQCSSCIEQYGGMLPFDHRLLDAIGADAKLFGIRADTRMRMVTWAIARWHGTYDNPEVAVILALPQWTLEHRSPRDEHGGEWWLLARRD